MARFKSTTTTVPQTLKVTVVEEGQETWGDRWYIFEDPQGRRARMADVRREDGSILSALFERNLIETS